MKKLLLCVFCLLSFSLIGCENQALDLNLINLHEGLCNNNLAQVQKALTDDALSMYGTPKGLIKLKRTFGRLQIDELSSSTPLITQTNITNPTETTCVRSVIYQINIYYKNQNKPLFNALLKCDTLFNNSDCSFEDRETPATSECKISDLISAY